MEEVLQKSKHSLSNKVELTEAEKEMLKSQSIEEVQARRAKLQKIRALISYQEAKMKRQKRIKSKKFSICLKLFFN